MNTKFIKKPIVIEAIQLTEKLFWETHDSKEPVFGKFMFSGSCHPKNRTIGNVYINVPTSEGIMKASLGDWIIKEPFPTTDRTFYPCKPDIFEKTYEPAKLNDEGEDSIKQLAEKEYPNDAMYQQEIDCAQAGLIKGYQLALKNNKAKWIKCSNRLPELNETVLLYIGAKIPVMACYKGGGKFLDYSLNDIWDVVEDGINFWQPLPQPPTESINAEG